MERHGITVRDQWQNKVEELGMEYHTIDGAVYWDESAYYRFSATEIDTLEAATDELHGMALKAVAHVIEEDLFSLLQIPADFKDVVVRSWEMEEPSLYGRFDLAYDGISPPRLLEYNADTPTALFEASVVQWYWMKERFPQADQFNSIHEKLIEFWKNFPYLRRGPIYFSAVKESPEDFGNVEYIRDTAIQGGMDTATVFIEDIGWDPSLGKFVDLQDRPIETLFKLYPWEWLISEEFGKHLHHSPCRMIEPAWKMILSNKGILPILWKLYEGHPNLLPSFFDREKLPGNYVQKPIFSREGGNVTIVSTTGTVTSSGTYGKEGYIYQEYFPMPFFNGYYPVIGSWIINNMAAGIGVREDASEITTNSSRFIPHIFLEG
jgi:glutathionylspermidine synthase